MSGREIVESSDEDLLLVPRGGRDDQKHNHSSSLREYKVHDLFARADSRDSSVLPMENEEDWGEYNVVLNNCEHFASYCATGEKKPGQVKKAVIAGAVGVGVAVGLTAIMLLIGNRDDEKEK